jgi:hypothetical protein
VFYINLSAERPVSLMGTAYLLMRSLLSLVVASAHSSNHSFCFITPTLEVLRQLRSPSRMDREVLEISSLVTRLVARPGPSEPWVSLNLLVDRLFEKPNRDRNRTVEGSGMP